VAEKISFCYTFVGPISSGLEAKMPNISVVLKNAMNLSIQDRAALAEKLLASLEQLSEKEAERLWADEAQRRLTEYRAGRSNAVPASETRRKVEKLFK
jgi:putative addiction module component (TIGR02574 family)